MRIGVIKLIDDEMKLSHQLCFSAYNVNKLFSKFYELSQLFKSFFSISSAINIMEENPQTLLSIGKKLNLASNTLSPLKDLSKLAGFKEIEMKAINVTLS